MKRPHSIILPTLLKSVSVTWRNKRTMIKRKRYMERRRKHCTQRDGRAKEEKKSEGRRVMEIGSEWASKVPGGHF